MKNSSNTRTREFPGNTEGTVVPSGLPIAFTADYSVNATGVRTGPEYVSPVFSVYGMTLRVSRQFSQRRADNQSTPVTLQEIQGFHMMFEHQDEATGRVPLLSSRVVTHADSLPLLAYQEELGRRLNMGEYMDLPEESATGQCRRTVREHGAFKTFSPMKSFEVHGGFRAMVGTDYDTNGWRAAVTELSLYLEYYLDSLHANLVSGIWDWDSSDRHPIFPIRISQLDYPQFLPLYKKWEMGQILTPRVVNVYPYPEKKAPFRLALGEPTPEDEAFIHANCFSRGVCSNRARYVVADYANPGEKLYGAYPADHTVQDFVNFLKVFGYRLASA